MGRQQTQQHHYGKGSVRMRGPHQYEARIMVNGKAYTRTADTEEKAAAYLVAISAAAAKGTLEGEVAARSITLEQALRERLQLKADLRSASSQHALTASLIRHFPGLTGKALYDVDERDIRAFIRARSATVCGSTVNHDLSIISDSFKQARLHLECAGLINPVAPGFRLKEAPARVRRLAPEEERALLAAAARYEVSSGVPVASIITFACETAMRRGEIAAMQWEHVDLAQGTVHLPTTKNGSARTVPLWPHVRALMRALGPKDRGPVWPKLHAITSAWLRTRAHAVESARAAGQQWLAQSLAEFRFHDLRHEGTSRLIERTGWSDARIMAVTGHKTNSMLKRYSHVRIGELAREMVIIAGGNTPPSPLVTINASGETVELPHNLELRARWRAVSHSRDLLAALVAVKPLTAIAEEFGISDVAVHKACARLGIEKKRVGYWLAKTQRRDDNERPRLRVVG